MGRPLSQGELQALISLLADDDRWTSDQARRYLVEAGEAAVPYLSWAAEGADARLAVRAQEALGELRFQSLREKLYRYARSEDGLSALENGAFLIAESAYPDLDVAAYRARLDAMAAAVAAQTCASRDEALAALNRHLFHEVGLRGNDEALSAVYVLVGGRLGFPLRGVSLPGHFIVGWFADDGVAFVDPFRGGRSLSVGDCARLAEASGATFHHGLLRPVPAALILVRMLNNLVQIYEQAGDADRVRRLKALQDAAAGRR